MKKQTYGLGPRFRRFLVDTTFGAFVYILEQIFILVNVFNFAILYRTCVISRTGNMHLNELDRSIPSRR